MDIRNVTPQLSVAPQILPQDVHAVHAMGFKSIVCNRPDGEGNDQPTFTEIQQEAEKLGMTCVYQPVTSGKVTLDDADTFVQSVQTLPGPTLAYCRTGTRSITLWAMSASKSLGPDEVLKLSQRAGYDLAGFAALHAG
ncbi:TIGR01244 family sulfur transferase [Alteromonas sp. CYL-A6]|uniref:TIGR01244 family sulfur transferase n=1 Tax=Alteromonas nitratireducens TaxID=3390813 RepID=UPI0034BF5722